MAEGKKSFVLYSDQRYIFEKLTDEQAGQLIKHIFAYVNDENPQGEFVTELAFESIKQALKRDLKKWEKQHQQRVEAGRKSAELRKQSLTTVDEPLRASTVNGNVSVSDSVNVNIPKLEDFISYGLEKEPLLDVNGLRLKFESWKENDWCTNRNGKSEPIKNWKTTLLNTIQYLPKQQEKKYEGYADHQLPNMDYINEKMKIVEEYERKNK